MLGVGGIMSAYRKGNVAIVNAVGNGVADDKAIYTFVPAMIRYYLNEEPILKNVPTYHLDNQEEKEYVFMNMNKMVVKKTNGSGGYGMLMGHTASEQEMEAYKNEILKDPRQYIAQPTYQFVFSPLLYEWKITAPPC